MSKFHCVVDTSALLKKYHQEAGTDIIKTLFNRDDCAIHVLNIAIPEVTGTFVRLQLEGTLSSARRAELLKLFVADITEYKVVVHNITHRNIVETDDVWDHSITVQQSSSSTLVIPHTCPQCNHS